MKAKMFYSRHQTLGVFVTLILLSSSHRGNRGKKLSSFVSSAASTAVFGPMVQTAPYGNVGVSHRTTRLGPFVTLILNAQPSDVRNCDAHQIPFALRSVVCSGSAVPVVSHAFYNIVDGRFFARQRQFPGN
jgi:hypothetical protein